MELSPRQAMFGVAWLACLLVFVWLALHAASGAVFPFDRSVSSWAREQSAGPLRPLFRFDRELGTPVPFTVFAGAAALLTFARGRSLEAMLLLSSFVAVGLEMIAKRLVQDPRLWEPVPWRHHIGFPSGHVVAIAVLFALIWVVAPRLVFAAWLTVAIRAVAVVLVISVGAERIWSRAHWPSEVIGGYVFAALFLALVIPFYIRRRQT